MNDPNRNYQNQGVNSNQSLDYEQWVNSLGNIQDGIFQNTPLSNSILQSTITNGNMINSNPNGNGNGTLNFNGNANSATNNNSFANSTGFGTTMQDLNLDMFFNSPERFYRDVINESPIVSKTPQFGRTPLKNLNINFSTPNFLKNIDSTLTGNPNPNSTSKNNFTPLKNQLFNSKIEIFETPKLNKHNSTTLNSSPTTIKISSSAIKQDDSNHPNNKMIPPSPTPTSKMSSSSSSVASSSQIQNKNQHQHQQQQQKPTIPKMGCFKKDTEIEKPNIQSKRSNQNTTKFQIIMTDVNTFANNSKNSKPKKKKLTRSSTTLNATSNSSNNSITKKNSLKRSLSQPQSNKIIKQITPLSHQTLVKQPEDHLTPNSTGASDLSNSLDHSVNDSTTNTTSNELNDLFDNDKILSDTEKLLDGGKYF